VIDSHCHLADEAFADDLDEVVERARQAGVTAATCILAAGDAREITQARRLLALWPAARFAVGIHPHQAGAFAGREADAAGALTAAIVEASAVRAVGEIGLDYRYDFAPREVQKAVFRQQLAVARERRLPVVIHTREADEDTFAILEDEGARDIGGILHCFTGDPQRARRGLAIGFHVSFAGIVTFPKAVDVRESARIVPADRLLIETDSPYLAPVPHRGARNEPAFVVETAARLAQIRGVPSDLLNSQITAVRKPAFHLNSRHDKELAR
jgi:TatD DNase family protein